MIKNFFKKIFIGEDEEDYSFDYKKSKHSLNIQEEKVYKAKIIIYKNIEKLSEIGGYIEKMRDNNTMIFNMSKLLAEEKTRFTDILTGSTNALSGKLELIDSNILLFKPSDIEIEML